jgi:hypothetical protein
MKMKNEPVAWMIQAQTWHEFTFSEPDMAEVEAEEWSVTPLYTHPAKTLTDRIAELEKENKALHELIKQRIERNLELQTLLGKYMSQAKTLTDEEIRIVIDEHWEKTSNVNLFDFARAILRKAQEK